MWKHLRNRQLLGLKFKRQTPVGPYFADFLCEDMQVILEIDGGQHNDNAKDEHRSAFLRAQGYDVLRFWNNDVLSNADGVLKSLTLTLSRRERGLRASGGETP
jgi:very-short-patch-repair endonuclease